MSPSLSARGHELLNQGELLDLMSEVSQHQGWDVESNPSGMISVAGAKNDLMGDFIEEHYANNMTDINLSKMLHYGPDTGSSALKETMATFFNRYFIPIKAVRQQDVLVTNGNSSLIEHLAWNLFDPGDAVLLPTPTYALFPYNFEGRANVQMLRVPMSEIGDQFKHDFASEVVQKFETAYEEAAVKGIRVKGVLLCNPNNPLGRCYSKHTLLEIAKFCRKKDLHLISDEVYAMSCFSTPTVIEGHEEGLDGFDGFTSALSIPNLDGENIHVTYGASKDFGMGGMRLGFLVTRNQELKQRIEKVGLYSWVTVSSDVFFRRFIGDLAAMDQYFDLFKERLRKSYNRASVLLDEHRIKFSPANAGLFVWIDLSEYLSYFEGSDKARFSMDLENSSREIKLCRHLIDRGLFISPGQFSESPNPGYFRFTITVNSKIVEAAVKRLALCLSLLKDKNQSHRDGL